MLTSAHTTRIVYRRAIWRSFVVQCAPDARSFSRFRPQYDELQHHQQRPSTPNDERKPPSPKASIRSKLLAFAIGSSIALAYAYYKKSQTPHQLSGSVDGFTKYTLLDKEPISSTCSIFTIAPLTGKKSVIDQTQHPNSIQSILLKQPDLQIARSYTILPPLDGQSDETIRLLIRKETKGEVSGYLHNVSVGSDIEVRGPYADVTLPADVSNAIFIAGGTGIAPAIKTAELLKGSANVHVLWASRKSDDCSGGVSDHQSSSLASSARSLFGFNSSSARNEQEEKNTLVLLLDLLKLQSRSKELTVDYFVDEQQSYVRPQDVARYIRANTDPTGSNLIIVSGPDGFVYHWAGRKEFVNGRQEQGKLGGILSKMDLTGWRVVKL